MVYVIIIYIFITIYIQINTSKEYEDILINIDKFDHSVLNNLNSNNIIHINKNLLEQLDNLDNIEYIAYVNDNNNFNQVIFNRYFINALSNYNSSHLVFKDCLIPLNLILNQDKKITIINSTLIIDVENNFIYSNAKDIIKYYFSKKDNYTFKNVRVNFKTNLLKSIPSLRILSENITDLKNNLTQNNVIKPSICESFKDCFNCTLYFDSLEKCEWSNYNCNQKVDNNVYLKTWWKNFDNCIDDKNSYYSMQNYCGNMLTKTIPFSIELLRINKLYGTNNLYCKWTAIVPANSPVIRLNYTRQVPSATEQMTIEIIYSSGKTYSENLFPKEYYVSGEGISKINIHYITTSSKIKSPFTLVFTIEEENVTNYLGLFIALGVVIFICMVCSVFFYKCSKIIIENNRRWHERRAIEIAALQTNHEVIREDDKKKENRELLEKLFNNELKPRRYDKHMNEYGSKCTICLEEFKNYNEIIKLQCKHIFHVKCLKEWLDKIILSPKCPNCNDTILTKKEDHDRTEIPEIHIRESIQNERNTSQNRENLLLINNNTQRVSISTGNRLNNQNNNNQINIQNAMNNNFIEENLDRPIE